MQKACEMVTSLLTATAPVQRCPYSTMNVHLLKLLQREGFIRGFVVEGNRINILLKRYQFAPVIRNIQVVSKPSRDIWLLPHELKERTGMNTGTWVMQTPEGFMTHRECIELGVGGKVIFAINTGAQKMNGVTLTYNVNPHTETVADLMDRIHREAEIDPDAAALIFRGQVISHEPLQTLGRILTESGQTVRMVIGGTQQRYARRSLLVALSSQVFQCSAAARPDAVRQWSLCNSEKCLGTEVLRMPGAAPCGDGAKSFGWTPPQGSRKHRRCARAAAREAGDTSFPSQIFGRPPLALQDSANPSAHTDGSSQSANLGPPSATSCSIGSEEVVNRFCIASSGLTLLFGRRQWWWHRSSTPAPRSLPESSFLEQPTAAAGVGKSAVTLPLPPIKNKSLYVWPRSAPQSGGAGADSDGCSFAGLRSRRNGGGSLEWPSDGVIPQRRKESALSRKPREYSSDCP
ncbi:hypothetical protein FOZ60_006423 [Perkinsus olseni]|uniref:Ubiquitin-like domain-containing protein n=1 Tax=Perkinsus olseni TaxID=32597 RepID=A0A7J6PHP8_PEROL|nr:hypothetical protein FOZ60_006423 [Perkinsus olseni]